MKPSEVLSEIKKAKSNPLAFFFAVIIILLISVFGFIGVKCLNGECDEGCKQSVYKYGHSAVCGVEQYVSNSSASCGVASYNSGTSAQCGVAQYNSCETGSGCGWMKVGGVLSVGKAKGNICRHQNCGVESYNTCRHSSFGIESYNTCRHSDHGVDSYKKCRNEEFGLEKCMDKPIWMFWMWGESS